MLNPNKIKFLSGYLDNSDRQANVRDLDPAAKNQPNFLNCGEQKIG
jgi:hypothetical protein